MGDQESYDAANESKTLLSVEKYENNFMKQNRRRSSIHPKCSVPVEEDGVRAVLEDRATP